MGPVVERTWFAHGHHFAPVPGPCRRSTASRTARVSHGVVFGSHPTQKKEDRAMTRRQLILVARASDRQSASRFCSVILAIPLLILAILLSSSPCGANPDGPVGSLSITPRFKFSTENVIWTTQTNGAGQLSATRDTRASTTGFDVLAPIWKHATVGVSA